MPTIKKIKVIKNSNRALYTATVVITNDPRKKVSKILLKIMDDSGQPNPEFPVYTLNYTLETDGKRFFKNENFYFDGILEGNLYKMTCTMYDMYNDMIPMSYTGSILIQEPMLSV